MFFASDLERGLQQLGSNILVRPRGLDMSSFSEMPAPVQTLTDSDCDMAPASQASAKATGRAKAKATAKGNAQAAPKSKAAAATPTDALPAKKAAHVCKRPSANLNELEGEGAAEELPQQGENEGADAAITGECEHSSVASGSASATAIAKYSIMTYASKGFVSIVKIEGGKRTQIFSVLNVEPFPPLLGRETYLYKAKCMNTARSGMG